jgi:hypothetical protein
MIHGGNADLYLAYLVSPALGFTDGIFATPILLKGDRFRQHNKLTTRSAVRDSRASFDVYLFRHSFSSHRNAVEQRDAVTRSGSLHGCTCFTEEQFNPVSSPGYAVDCVTVVNLRQGARLRFLSQDGTCFTRLCGCNC